MNSQKGIVGCLLLACTLQMPAQVKTYKYRVNFRDKAETTYTLDNPSAYLSERALERRMRQRLPVDSTDLPVCQSYIDMLVGKGVCPVSKSKWNNTVVVQVSDTSVIDKVAALPFVAAVRKVWTAPDSIPARNADRKKEVTNKVTKSNNYYGDAWRQIAVHHGDSLHAAGFRGKGMQPIAGYNFGAQQYHRVNQVLKLTIYGATTVTTTGFLVGELMPELAVSAFTTHEGLIQLSATGLRIVVIFFPIIGFQMVTSNFFQSIGMAGKAIFLSLTRQLLFLLPCIILLPLFWGSAGIWWSMPISDLAASIVAGVMLYRQFKIFNTHGNKLKVEN